MILPPCFTTSRLMFRAADPVGDLDFMLDMYQDPVCFLQTSLGTKPVKKSDAEGQLKNLAETAALGVIIVEQASQKPIGFASIDQSPFALKFRRASFGLCIHKDFQRKGYGQETMAWLIDYAFEWMNLNRFEGNVLGFNTGARVLYRSVGFIEEGESPEFFFFNGEWTSDVKLGILRSAWDLKKAEKTRTED